MRFSKKIPVCSPAIPSQEGYIRYLEDIKAVNLAAGKRPLAQHLAKRFEEIGETPANTAALFSNGKSAMAGAIRALGIVPGKKCLLPSWIAPTVLDAVLANRLEPHFIDVDKESWGITPESVRKDLNFIAKKQVGLVIFSAPFDVFVDATAWDSFTEETGIPVVIDVAANFDSLISKRVSFVRKTPIVLDFNIYSLLPVDEGGVVLSRDADFINTIKKNIYYGAKASGTEGFFGSGDGMSEYAAAFFHAALDEWSVERTKWKKLTDHYIDAFIDTPVDHRLSFEFVSSVCNVYIPDERADEVISLMAGKGLQAVKWWGNGCHTLDYAKTFSKFPLPVTEHLTKSVVGIPFYPGLAKRDVLYIVQFLSEKVYGKKVRR